MDNETILRRAEDLHDETYASVAQWVSDEAWDKNERDVETLRLLIDAFKASISEKVEG